MAHTLTVCVCVCGGARDAIRLTADGVFGVFNSNSTRQNLDVEEYPLRVLHVATIYVRFGYISDVCVCVC